MNSQISADKFTKLIKQANLTLDNQDIVSIRSQLNEALDSIKVFDELNTKGVTPLAQPIADLHNVLREDVIADSFTQEQALSQADHQHEGYFLVKAVFANEDN